MKRNRHITINIDNDLYIKIKYLSDTERRKIADYIYLLVADEIEKKIIKKTDIATTFNKSLFINE